MGIINEKRKFKPTKKQSNPTNPVGNKRIKNNSFNIEEETIKKQQSKT